MKKLVLASGLMLMLAGTVCASEPIVVEISQDVVTVNDSAFSGWDLFMGVDGGVTAFFSHIPYDGTGMPYTTKRNVNTLAGKHSYDFVVETILGTARSVSNTSSIVLSGSVPAAKIRVYIPTN